MTSDGDRNWYNDVNFLKHLSKLSTRYPPSCVQTHLGMLGPSVTPFSSTRAILGEPVSFRITDALVTAEDAKTVAELPTDSARYAYAQAARVLGRPVKQWNFVQRQRAFDALPEVEALRKEICDLTWARGFTRKEFEEFTERLNLKERDMGVKPLKDRLRALRQEF